MRKRKSLDIYCVLAEAKTKRIGLAFFFESSFVFYPLFLLNDHFFISSYISIKEYTIFSQNFHLFVNEGFPYGKNLRLHPNKKNQISQTPFFWLYYPSFLFQIILVFVFLLLFVNVPQSLGICFSKNKSLIKMRIS